MVEHGFGWDFLVLVIVDIFYWGTEWFGMDGFTRGIEEGIAWSFFCFGTSFLV